MDRTDSSDIIPGPSSVRTRALLITFTTPGVNGVGALCRGDSFFVEIQKLAIAAAVCPFRSEQESYQRDRERRREILVASRDAPSSPFRLEACDARFRDDPEPVEAGLTSQLSADQPD